MHLQAVKNMTASIFNATDSDRNSQIKTNPQVKNFFANTGSSEYLNVFSEVKISNDTAKIKDLWSMWVKAWF